MKDEKTEEPTWNEIMNGLTWAVILLMFGIAFAVCFLLLVSHLYYQYQIEHLI